MSRRSFVFHCLAAFLCVLPSAMAEEAWYTPVLSAFEEAGYIAAGAMVPQAPATRWKFLDLLLRLKGGVVHGPFASVTFDDISAEDPQYFLFEEGAAQGWVRGVENCVGKHPCLAFPRRAINRAEAAALIVRAFGLQTGGDAPVFSDSRSGAWYEEMLRTAASHCVFRGDDVQKTVRPDALLNQAEMLAALSRAVQGLRYPHCDVAVTTVPPAPTALQIQLPLPPMIPEHSSSSFSSFTSVVSGASSVSSSPSLQSAQQTPQVTLPGSSSSSISSVTTASDPGYTQFLARYDEYVAAFGTSLSATKFSADDTALRVLNLLKAQMDMIAGYYQYVSIARQRVLSTGEKQVADSLRLAIEAAFENIRGIQQ